MILAQSPNGATGPKRKQRAYAPIMTSLAGVETLVSTAILVTLWVLMARFNRAGAKWARIVASFLCAFSTWYTFQLVSSLKGGGPVGWNGIVYLTLSVIVWSFAR